MAKPFNCPGGKKLFTRVEQSCNILEHYHLAHTNDVMTRLRTTGPQNAEPKTDIYIVSDPVWREKLREFTDSEFPKQRSTVQ